MDVTYKFCPNCAHPLQDELRFGRTRRACSRCGFVYFREPKVAVAVLVTDGRQRVLLIRRDVEPRRGLWALPSGFIDFDEDPRDAAIREAKEETGLDVQVLSVLDVSTVGDPDARSGVVLFFSARATGGTLRPGDDAVEVSWFSPSEVPLEDLAFASTHQLLTEWRDGLVAR